MINSAFAFLTLLAGVLWAFQSLLAMLDKDPKHSQIMSKNGTKSTSQMIDEIETLSSQHETAEAINLLLKHDGAGVWPPNANHNHEEWPKALQPYRQLYMELASSLAVTTPSLDDGVNSNRIANFRLRFRKLLDDRVNLTEVMAVLEGAVVGGGDSVSRESYNAFYCCISWCRHAYR